jgi:DNA-binding GntR family transcriptional regulator
MTAQTLANAQSFCDRFGAETDVAKWADLNWRFHSCLYEDASRPFMVSLIRSVNDRIERFLRIQLSLSAGQAVADREHREILAACRAGDAELASRLVNRHITDACSSLLLHLGKSR